MHTGMAHLYGRTKGQMVIKEVETEGNARVEQHAGEEVGVIVRLDDEEVSFDVTCG